MSDNSSEFNQRSMKAIILCVMVTIVYTQLFLAPQQAGNTTGRGAASTVASGRVDRSASELSKQAAVSVAAVPSVAGATSKPAITRAQVDSAEKTQVDVGVSKVAISHLGARLIHYNLKNYRQEATSAEPLDLVGADEQVAVLPLGVYVGGQSDADVVYTLASNEKNIALALNERRTLEFRGVWSDGTGITKRITFTGGSYLFSVDVALDKPAVNGQTVWVEWSHLYPSEIEDELRIKHVITLLDGENKIDHLQVPSIGQGIKTYGAGKWVALGDTYFASILIPDSIGANTAVGRTDDLFYGRVAGGAQGGSFHAYVGPKDYKLLASQGAYQLERSIDLGWFSFLALPLLWLLHALYGLLGNYGVAIIALTLLVKAVMLPLSKASFSSARKMQELQPEIKALRERIKDPTQLNQEMFSLYKRKGVNPMGGCFPMLIQIPVFLGLYNALLNAIELRHAPFALWITDLSAPESLEILGVGVPVMVLLMAVSMVYQTWTTPNPSADPNQQKMMMIMPLVFAGMFIVFPMPAGLVLYWLVNNIISIIQQLYMRSAEKGSVYVGTAVASAVIFGVGVVLTLV